MIEDIPDGYITGVSRRRLHRARNGEIIYTIAHLYKGTFDEVGMPMCRRGYEDDGAISIFRNNVGSKGVCKTCLRRAKAGLEPAEWQKGQMR